jgi:glutamine amidotransferase
MSEPLRKILIVDVGLSNIASVQRMLEKVGSKTVLASKPDDLLGAKKIVLPGVGHFDEGVRRLQKLGLADTLVSLVMEEEARVLGICLGMQLLCRSSEEGSRLGLGLIDAEVKKFRFTDELKLKIPHMGWNVVSSPRANVLLSPTLGDQRFYFVHSYKVVPDNPNIIIGTANYGGEFCAAFQQGNIFGVQFHPEKSHRFGMELMRRFVEL